MSTPFLQSPESVAFSTRDYAAALEMSVSAASHALARLSRAEIVTRVTQGVWANTHHPYFTPLACIPKLLGAEQGYLSFVSALHMAGAISQIPATIQVATTGRGRVVRTPLGTFELFQIKPELMQEGIAWSSSRAPYRVASSEKALLDTLYLATRKGRRFASLPEVDCDAINFRLAEKLLGRYQLLPSIKRALLFRLRNLEVLDYGARHADAI